MWNGNIIINLNLWYSANSGLNYALNSNHVRQKKSGRIIEEEVRNPTKPRHFQANKDRQSYYDQLEKKSEKKNSDKIVTEDIWVEKDFRDDIPGLKDEKGWISRDLALYTTKNIGKPVIKVHASIRHRTTKAKLVENN